LEGFLSPFGSDGDEDDSKGEDEEVSDEKDGNDSHFFSLI
jgi:hypothetical protein